jgi:hypothetical protein
MTNFWWRNSFLVLHEFKNLLIKSIVTLWLDLGGLTELSSLILCVIVSFFFAMPNEGVQEVRISDNSTTFSSYLHFFHNERSSQLFSDNGITLLNSD